MPMIASAWCPGQVDWLFGLVRETQCICLRASTWTVPPLVQNSRAPRPAFIKMISHRPALLNSALPSDSALPLSTAPLCHPPIKDQVTSRKCPSWRYITQSDRNSLFLIRGPAPRPPSLNASDARTCALATRLRAKCAPLWTYVTLPFWDPGEGTDGSYIDRQNYWGHVYVSSILWSTCPVTSGQVKKVNHPYYGTVTRATGSNKPVVEE